MNGIAYRFDGVDNAGGGLAMARDYMSDGRILGKTLPDFAGVDLNVLGTFNTPRWNGQNLTDSCVTPSVGSIDTNENLAVGRDERAQGSFQGEGSTTLHRNGGMGIVAHAAKFQKPHSNIAYKFDEGEVPRSLVT